MSGFEIRPVSAKLSVAPQITADDLQKIKDAGFRAIICNRPDGEGANQPTFDEISTAAQKLGLETRYHPIVAGKVGDGDAKDFAETLSQLPGPVLAYCRTGTRSAMLWSLSQANNLTVADIFTSTKPAGYDMGSIVRRIVNGGKTPTDQADVKSGTDA